jgi:hypothetical protein
MSPLGSDCIIIDSLDAWRAVSEDPDQIGFLLIVRTGSIVTAIAVRPDTRMFQHIAKFNNRLYNGYSYRRRLLGLGFKASPCG